MLNTKVLVLCNDPASIHSLLEIATRPLPLHETCTYKPVIVNL
jgi:hypothetical protein